VEIFGDLNKTYTNIPGRIKAEAFKQRVMSCFRAWEDWALYPMDFLISLQNVFLGLVGSSSPEPERPASGLGVVAAQHSGDETDEDVDGIPLDGAALLKAGGGAGPAKPDRSPASDSSVDGAPIEAGNGVVGEDKRAGQQSAARPSGGFVSSKWETVDPEAVRAGAITTSKWEAEETEQLVKARKALMGSVASKWEQQEQTELDGEPLQSDGDSDGEPLEIDPQLVEERRALLRDVEVKVMEYQDELEAGRGRVKAGWTISEQVEHYRRKMVRRAMEARAEPSPPPRRERSRSQSDTSAAAVVAPRSEKEKERGGRKKKRRKSRTESVSRSRSRSPKPRKSRRKRSPSSSPERRSSKRSRSRSTKRRRKSKSRSRSRRRKSKSQSRSRSRSPRKHKKKRH